MTYNTLLAELDGNRVKVTLVQRSGADLDAAADLGDVTVDIEYSTLNYKDALAMSHRIPVIRNFPLVPGIDFAGTVRASADPRFAVGDRVVATGWELSQTHDGGLSQRARVPGDWLIKLPPTLTTRDAMAIGTAGLTAMLCVLALEHGNAQPENGDVLVTGAVGGVGSIATAILSKLGYRVVASTGRPEHAEYLHALGAAEVIDRNTLARPVEKGIASERWAAAIDVAGSTTLASVLAHTKYRGVVAVAGIAQGVDLPGSMLPFILRNVTLAGIDSVYAPQAVREQAWQRLATDLDLRKLESTVQMITLQDVLELHPGFLDGKVQGRLVVDVNA